MGLDLNLRCCVPALTGWATDKSPLTGLARSPSRVQSLWRAVLLTDNACRAYGLERFLTFMEAHLFW